MMLKTKSKRLISLRKYFLFLTQFDLASSEIDLHLKLSQQQQPTMHNKLLTTLDDGHRPS